MASEFELDMQDVDALRSAVYTERQVLDYIAAGYNEAPEAEVIFTDALDALSTALEAFAGISAGDGEGGGAEG